MAEDFDPFALGATPSEPEFDPFALGAKPTKPDATVDNMHAHIRRSILDDENSVVPGTRGEVRPSALGGELPVTPYTGKGYVETLKGRASEGLEKIKGAYPPVGDIRPPWDIPARVGGGLWDILTSPLYAGANKAEYYTGIPADEATNAITGAAGARGAGGAAGLAVRPVIPPGPLPSSPLATPRYLSGLPKIGPEIPPEAVRTLERAAEFGVNLPPANALGNTDAIAFREMAARPNAPYGSRTQQVARDVKQRLENEVAGSGQVLAERIARAHGQRPAANETELADVINTRIGQAAERARADLADADAGIGRVQEGIRGPFAPIEDVRQAADIVRADTRAAAASAREQFKSRYDEAEARQGSFAGTAFDRVGDTLERGLRNHRDDPVNIDHVNTPSASAAIRDLNNHPRLALREDPGGDPLPVDLRDVLQARKQLSSHYNDARRNGQGATTSDVRAMTRLIDAYDSHIENSVSNGLFSGDPRAIGAFNEATALYRQYARTYRPQFAGDDVGTAMRRIVDRNATPGEIANMITDIGSFQKGLPVRIMDRLSGVLGRDSEAFNAVRQAVVLRTHVFNRLGEIDPLATANNMERLARSDLGRAHFTVPETDAILNQVRGIRQAHAAYGVFSEPGIGGAQATAWRNIIAGTASPEETANALFGVINKDNPGNVNRLVSAIGAIAGPESPAMGAVRQGVLRRLTDTGRITGPDGVVVQPGKSANVIARDMREFMEGGGRTIAERLFPHRGDRMMINRYISTLEAAGTPPEARVTSPTAPLLMSAARHFGAGLFPAGTIRGAIARFAATHTIGAVNDIRGAGRLTNENIVQSAALQRQLAARMARRTRRRPTPSASP